ncbi:glycoside hydrolase family 3 N-terminal domain-containing protein [Pseudobacteroides cellulosolvens]|uniref:beta-glucosidase n=1 Tax=Pseudobacteroides cellulosolvens ATCC 35603 = DSM 2933 TaxID=398512 RepID=A0A0L6JSQ8_9FIRM|nr:glycoside hydrolase family 3 N-terminal domain-containing protein [Pseudobacteroides cellulosolvens]KNY28735.1 glycoside hydrolase family 3 domain protein [Pseudobacteroides cellulosolvens ATCC 35603 = DSM 2933]
MLIGEKSIRKKSKSVLSIFVSAVTVSSLVFVNAPTNVKAANVYQDPSQPVESRVKDLLSRMTLDEKVGQMIQPERHTATADDVKNYYLGSILSGGGNVPLSNTPTGWCDMTDAYQKAAMSTRLQIPFIYGVDAVHGHNNLYGATIFPHNIGLGAANDEELVYKIGQITAKEVRATGVHWTFAPCIAVPQNEKWGRTYEGFSENTDIVTRLGVAATKGLQGDNYLTDLTKNDKILGCIKHFIGDGATTNGVDASDSVLTEDQIREKYLPPYIEAIKAGARTLMASFSSINGLECHGNKRLLTDILKNELKFDGFVVSDYEAIKDIDKANFRNCVKESVNAGVDMYMEPRMWKTVITHLKDLVGNGEVPMSRIDDAVTRILRVKIQLGLFEKPYADRSLMSQVGSADHRAVAREAVRKSLVLLKNDNKVLPLAKSGKKIFVAGKNADDLGNQCGGWTITWQGKSGNITQGTTILQGIKSAVNPGTTVTYNLNGYGAQGHDVAVVVVGETPYAEVKGDRTDVALSADDIQTINNVKSAGIPMVVVLVSGRPMIVTDQIKDSAAFVAAWLPGTEGNGVSDCLFGDYDFSGKLPMSWPSSNAQIPVNEGDGKTPLYQLGYGLKMKADEGYKLSGYVSPDFAVISAGTDLKQGFKVEVVGKQLNAVTDAKGYFEIKGLPLSTDGYSLKISKTGYLTRTISNILLTADKELSSQSSPVEMWVGDIPKNGIQDDAINMADVISLAKVFNAVSSDAHYESQFDLNLDGSINMSDIILLAKHFNATAANYPAV